MTNFSVGFWLNAQGISESTLLEVARKSKSRSHTVANGIALAGAVYSEAAKFHADPVIVVREDISFDQNYRDPRYANMAEYVASAKRRLGNYGLLHWQLFNEPVCVNKAELLYMLGRCIAFMDECARQGIRGSVGGFADAATWHWPLVQSGDIDPFLRHLCDWTAAGHGVGNHHNYSYDIPAMCGGGRSAWDMTDPAKFKNWPTAKEMQEYSPGVVAQGADDFDALLAGSAAAYLTGERAQYQSGYTTTMARFIDTHEMPPELYLSTHFVAQGAEANWLNMRYMWPMLRAKALGYPNAYTAVEGEGWHDDLPNLRVEGVSPAIERKYADGRKLRGTLDQRVMWPRQFDGEAAESVYVRILEHEASVRPANVIGVHLFALNVSPDWRTFNLLQWPEFWPVFYSFVERTIPVTDNPTPPVIVATVEKPEDCGHPTRAKVHTSTTINVRNAPQRLNSRIEGAAKEGDAVDWYPDTKRTADGLDWYYVEMLAFKGWMARVWATIEQQFETIEVPTTPPIDPVPPPPDDDDTPEPPATDSDGVLVSVFLTMDEARQYHKLLRDRLDIDTQIADLWQAAIARANPPQVTTVIALGAPAVVKLVS